MIFACGVLDAGLDFKPLTATNPHYTNRR
jgi:hypothetical protein